MFLRLIAVDLEGEGHFLATIGAGCARALSAPASNVVAMIELVDSGVCQLADNRGGVACVLLHSN